MRWGGFTASPPDLQRAAVLGADIPFSLVEGAALKGVKITLEAAAEDTEAAEAAKCSAKEVSREFNTSETTGIDIMPRYNPKH